MAILLVDDCEVTRKALQSLLESRGYRDVLCAVSGEEALRLLTAEAAPPVEVVLMDVEMAGMDGIETCRRLKAVERLHDIPVLILTGNAQEQALEAAFEAGACDFLNKPVQVGELLARMRSALTLKHQLDQCKARERELVGATRRLTNLNEELRRLAILDELTGIANRRFFNLLLNQEWARAMRDVHPLSLILIDIDFFKNFNDQYGHLMGDDCLKRVASALTAVVKRPGDHVARYGGEEFVVLMPHTGVQGAAAVAERLRRQVEELGLEHDCSAVHDRVTISLGVGTALPERGGGPDQLIAAADQAVYRAKREGRNQVRVFEGFPDRAFAAPHVSVARAVRSSLGLTDSNEV